MRRRSLTTRLVLSHLLATVVALVVLGCTVVLLLERNERVQATTMLDSQAAVYATYAAELAPTAQILVGVTDTLTRRFPATPGVIVRIFSPNGQLLSSNGDISTFPSREVQPYISRQVPTLSVAPATRRYIARPIQQGGQTIGVVEVSRALELEHRPAREVLLALVPGAALALLGATLLAIWLARSLLRPLSALRRVAHTIATGNLLARSDDRSPDEIGQLAIAIDRMASDLAVRFDEVERLSNTRREFYRTVSHELRTPLTAIRGLAENLEDSATPDQERSLQLIQAETTRLQRLVDELLAGGERAFVPRRQQVPVDIGALAANTVALMGPRAERAGVELVFQAQAQGTIEGDPDRLRQAFVNLLDNALKWTPAGGQVNVRITNAPAPDVGICITVSDTGSGIPAELRDHIWERGSHGPDGGQGLGLALVHEVASAHGGSVELGEGPGTTIRVCLPLSTPHLH